MTEASILCPIAPAGLCLYEACPYWEGEKGCTACFQEVPDSWSTPGDPAVSPCVIPWQEETD
ncbi:MAG: hypothetical protein WHT07_06730 [Desulfobaccales bacterium]